MRGFRDRRSRSTHRSILYSLLLVPLVVASCSEAVVSPTPSPDRAAPVMDVLHSSGVIINEVMADPNAASDDNGEWFELHNTGSTSVNVSGWTIVSNNDVAHTISGSVTIAAGGYRVFVRNDRKSNNGGISGGYKYGTGITLANSNDWLAIRDGSGVPVDSVAWTSTPTGATRGVTDAGADNTDMNGSAWGTATSTYGKGDKGTPGAQNDGVQAAVAAVAVAPATASVAEGSTQQFTASATDAGGNPVATTFTWSSSNSSIATVSSSGLATAVAAGTAVIRATAPNGVYDEASLTVQAAPSGGIVIITEILANPAAVTDANGEWFEVHNPGSSAVDLQGWSIASNNDGTHTIGSSVVVPAGGYAVIGRLADSGTNGGVSIAYAYGSALNLANSADWLVVRDDAGVTVDSVAWSSVGTGASSALISLSADNSNANSTNWDESTATFGAGDKGTPGAANTDVSGGGGGTAGDLVVRVLDIGQGDATYITDGVSKVFIDGGPSESTFGAHLDALGLNNTTIDVVIISHAHFDHYSGLRQLFETSRGITVRYLFENKDAGTAVSLAELRDSINARVGRGELIYRDTDDPCGNGSPLCTITMAGGAKLHVLQPDPQASDPNNRSGAVKLVGPDSASFSMWFAGDAEHEAIGWFDTGAQYDLAPGMNVDVLKADHHGSCNGVTSRYLDLLSPDWVAIGVGSTNTYGHVHNQTKDLMTSKGIPWYRTDLNGTITFTAPAAGGGYTVDVEQGGSSLSGSTDATSAQSACQNL